MKKVTHYFVYVGYANKTKNRLQEDFSDYLRSLEGDLTDYKHIGRLKNRIIDKSVELNKVYSRCSPLKISFSEPCDDDDEKGFVLSGFSFLYFELLEAYSEQ